MDCEDLTERCIRHDASVLDQELFGQESPLYQLFNSYDSMPSIKEEKEDFTEEAPLPSEDSAMEQQESQSSIVDSVPIHDSHQNLSTTSNLPTKRKSIHKVKFSVLFLESDEESVSRRRKAVRHRRRRGEVNGYPTKNFLPNFKGPHLQYLENELGAQFVNSFPLIQEIKAKNGISMNDYQLLYNVPEFEKTFLKFFRTRVLYRELMLSRSSLTARKIHMKKLSVFEEAFLSKEFTKIN